MTEESRYESVMVFTGKKPINPKALELMKKANAENAEPATEPKDEPE